MCINCFKADLYCFSSLDKILRLCGRWLKTFILKQAPSRNVVNFVISGCKSVLRLELVLWILELYLYNSLFPTTYSNKENTYCEYFNIPVILKTCWRWINILQRIICDQNLTIIITQWESKNITQWVLTFTIFGRNYAFLTLSSLCDVFQTWRSYFYDGAFRVYNNNKKYFQT